MSHIVSVRGREEQGEGQKLTILCIRKITERGRGGGRGGQKSTHKNMQIKLEGYFKAKSHTQRSWKTQAMGGLSKVFFLSHQ